MRNRQPRKVMFPSFTELLIATSFVALLLLPKSMSLLKLGGFEFAWGVGDVILILMFLPFIGEILLTGKVQFPYGINRLDKAFLLYTVSLLYPVIIAFVRHPEKSIFTIASYIKYIEFFMIYYLLRRTLYKEVQATYLLKIFVVVWAGVLLISIIQKISPRSYLSIWETIGSRSRALPEGLIRSVRWRLSGPFFNPNTLAQFLLLAIPMGWAIYSFKHRLLTKLFYLCMTVLSLAVFILTQSRSGYFGFLVMLAVFMYYTGFKLLRFRKMHILVIAILVGLGLFYRSVLYHRVVEYSFHSGEGFGASIVSRFILWEASIHATSRHWLVGIGYGENRTALIEILQSEYWGGSHNTFFRVLIEGGIIIFGIFLFLLAQIWSWRKTKLAEPWNRYKYALIAGYAGLLITGFSGDTFQDAKIMICFSFLLGIINSISQLQKRKLI